MNDIIVRIAEEVFGRPRTDPAVAEAIELVVTKGRLYSPTGSLESFSDEELATIARRICRYQFVEATATKFVSRGWKTLGRDLRTAMIASVVGEVLELVESLPREELVLRIHSTCRRYLAQDTLEFRWKDGDVRRSKTLRCIKHPHLDADGEWHFPLDDVAVDADGKQIPSSNRNVAEDRVIASIDSKRTSASLRQKTVAAIGADGLAFLREYAETRRRGEPKTAADRQKYHRLRERLQARGLLENYLSRTGTSAD